MSETPPSKSRTVSGTDGLQVAYDISLETVPKRAYYDDQYPIHMHDNRENLNPLSDNSSEGATFPLTKAQGSKRRRICGLPVIGLVVAILSFVLGGAIGGGVGAGVRLNARPASASPTSTSNATCTPPITLNAAGCPLSNGTTYTSSISTTVSNYQVFCDKDISAGIDINEDGTYEPSLGACLDACTAYNINNQTQVATTGECVGAGWVIYSPGNTPKNGLCFFKRDKSIVDITDGETIVAGVLLS